MKDSFLEFFNCHHGIWSYFWNNFLKEKEQQTNLTFKCQHFLKPISCFFTKCQINFSKPFLCFRRTHLSKKTYWFKFETKFVNTKMQSLTKVVKDKPMAGNQRVGGGGQI